MLILWPVVNLFNLGPGRNLAFYRAPEALARMTAESEGRLPDLGHEWIAESEWAEKNGL